jgi:hypothetical protein
MDQPPLPRPPLPSNPYGGGMPLQPHGDYPPPGVSPLPPIQYPPVSPSGYPPPPGNRGPTPTNSGFGSRPASAMSNQYPPPPPPPEHGSVYPSHLEPPGQSFGQISDDDVDDFDNFIGPERSMTLPQPRGGSQPIQRSSGVPPHARPRPSRTQSARPVQDGHQQTTVFVSSRGRYTSVDRLSELESALDRLRDEYEETEDDLYQAKQSRRSWRRDVEIERLTTRLNAIGHYRSQVIGELIELKKSDLRNEEASRRSRVSQQRRAYYTGGQIDPDQYVTVPHEFGYGRSRDDFGMGRLKLGHTRSSRSSRRSGSRPRSRSTRRTEHDEYCEDESYDSPSSRRHSTVRRKYDESKEEEDKPPSMFRRVSVHSRDRVVPDTRRSSPPRRSSSTWR